MKPALIALALFTPFMTARAADLDNIWTLREGESHRASSADADWQNGNGDCKPIEPGGTLNLLDAEGPGMIRHIWFTIASPDPTYPRSLVLRMYWDDQTAPAVECPLGDFFAVGHGMLRNLNSAPVAISSDGRAYNCYWPMPYRRHARITLTNDSKQYRVDCVYFQVDYYRLQAPAPNQGYFHAQYRQEYPCVMDHDYLILDAEGSGQYVGTVLSAVLRTREWFGEGDDRFYIDGAAEPQLRGTGTEDYFCDAWGFRPFDRPFYGVPILEGYGIGDRLTAYRWHIPDPVLFHKSLKVAIEHKGVTFDKDDKLVSSFMERADLFSSVAFWYQNGPAKRYAELPPVEQRTVPVRTIELDAASDKVKTEPSAKVNVQPGGYSDGKQLFVQVDKPGGKLTVPFQVNQEINGMARLKLTQSWDYGIYRVSLDGKALKGMDSVDLFNVNTLPHETRLGLLNLTAGPHELTFECTGKNPASKGYFIGVDAIAIEELTPFVVAGK